MGYLGYDPDQLVRLRAFLDALAAERARTRFDDPLSFPAGDSYGRASAGVLRSRERIDAVLSCSLDSPFRPVALDVSLALVDVLRLADPAWTTVTDPGIAHTEPVLAAAHLAEYLAASGLADAFDPKTAADLRRRLEVVAADPSAAAAFLTALGVGDLAALVDRLWMAIATPFDDGERRRADDALAAVASVVGQAERNRPGRWAEYVEYALADRDRSITAIAALAHGASLPPTTLGATFGRLSAAATARPEPEPAVHAADGTVLWSTAQALSDALAGQPAVANAVVAALDAATLAWLLTATNASSTGPLLWAATSPLAETAADAERAVGNVLTRLAGAHHLVTPELRGWLGAVVAPWSGQLVALPRPSYATTWAVASDAVAIGELRWILSAADAADIVTRWLVTTTPAGLAGVLAAGAPTAERVYDWAEHLGVAAARISSERVDDARRRLAAWKQGWRLPLAAANSVVVHAARLDPVSSYVATQTLIALEGRAIDGLADHGALGAPPPIERVTVDEVRRFELIEAILVASARRTVFDELIARGQVPPGAEPPPAAQVTSANPMEGDTEAMREWTARALPVIGVVAVAEVTDVGNATQNGFGRGNEQAEHDPRR